MRYSFFTHAVTTGHRFVDFNRLSWLLSSGLGRHSQIGKAAVCKTVYSRFKSGCRLQLSLVNPSDVPPSALAPFRVGLWGKSECLPTGRVVELAYTTDLKSVSLAGLRVQVPPRPPKSHTRPAGPSWGRASSLRSRRPMARAPRASLRQPTGSWG